MTALVASLISLLSRLTRFGRRSESASALHKFGFPYPQTHHYTVPSSHVENKRLLVIGDVHGCYDELLELLDAADANSDNTLLIFVGDLVNKGPKSKQVLDFVRGRGSSALSVRGNHDESCLRELYQLGADPSYAVSDKYRWLMELTDEDRLFLLQLPYTIRVGAPFTFLVVHAGLVPGRPLTLQRPEEMVTMRNLVEDSPFEEGLWEGLRATRSSREGLPWASLWPGPEHIYFGHDARRLWQDYPHATGLDTGCVYGKHLTAVLLSSSQGHGVTTQRYSVQAKHVYCPVD